MPGLVDVSRSGRRDGGSSHAAARAAFRLSVAYLAVAAAWGLVVLVGGGSWWAPLHAFLAGSVLLAISGAAPLFTVTWSSARPPPGAVAATQRWLVAAGVALVLAGRSAAHPGVAVVGATGVAVGLALLGWMLVTTVRRSLLGRFDLSSRFYLMAVGAGAVGVVIGGVLVAGVAPGLFLSLRAVHARLNLVGLVGLTIVGTLPTLLPTFAHRRAAGGGESVIALAAAACGLVAVVGGIWWSRLLGFGPILVALAALLVAGGALRVGWGGAREGGLPFAMVTAGVLWLSGAWIVDGTELLAGTGAGSRILAMAVVPGVGQVLLGSLVYLVPVLLGPDPVRGRAAGRMTRGAVVPFALANVAGTLLLLGASGAVVGVVAGAWVIDFLIRLGSALTVPRRDRGME